MAGVSVGDGGQQGRRSLDSQINMVPMIDLLIVTIAFLLITAEWTRMARIDADAQVPGRAGDEPPPEPEKQLHVHMRAADGFVLVWKQGRTTIESIDVPQREVPVAGESRAIAFPELKAKIADEWLAKGQHASPTDGQRDVAVLHTDNRTEYRELVAAMDAIRDARRLLRVGTKVESVPAFETVFSVE